ncbi:MAG TPA: phosphoglucosamine mutase [Candidatus Omnitrophota bacterium]|nr:phosphoglucosamine mutase [Candidatus Omnitrophota bacterium]
MLKISVSGVRGIANDSLTPAVCLDFAKAAGTYFKGGTLLLGNDTRESSEFIKGIVMQGLLSCGCRIIDLGIVPTPTLGFMIRHLKADGGIMITASHNPKEWNGLKFMRSDGIFLNSSQGEELLEIYESNSFSEKPGGSVKVMKRGGESHIKKVLSAVNRLKIRSKKFKVVLDSVNGAGSIITPLLLKKLGCRVVEINTSVRSPFPHGAEPTPENLAQLAETVVSENADIGFAQDPDADRLALVTDEGVAISEEYTLALCAKHVLTRSLTGKRIVVANLSTTRALDDIAKDYGAVVLRTKVGEVHVAEAIKAEKALIGGEGNGGVIFPKVGYNRDSLAGMALILEYMAAEGKPVSALSRGIPEYHSSKLKKECRSQDEADNFIVKIKEHFARETLDTTEGIKVLLKDSWVHVRPSNTEPIIRVIAEARTKDEARRLAESVLKI